MLRAAKATVSRSTAKCRAENKRDFARAKARLLKKPDIHQTDGPGEKAGGQCMAQLAASSSRPARKNKTAAGNASSTSSRPARPKPMIPASRVRRHKAIG